ncbi:uncharacterized protein SAPINGB_P002158 [Magnusiomyces paraingens]|uniref:ABC transporter domain-containing protein n=1 Tax=Magnusiomyces paraingens TaxID=2606893 RepID=A0A5E8BDU0_9ASCO|nr:uncharacterized protein SAPINGB_P002158 [Saprochaete ingens]VVT49212.1 unnamed protein product [Saprochaete ingens]
MSKQLPVIKLENCLVRPLMDKVSKPLFPNPINLTINPNERWAVTGPRKLDLLSVIGAKHIPTPALSRTYPFLENSIWPSQAIQLVEFKGSVLATHLSARYEHFRDEFDIPLSEYLGQTFGTQAGPNKDKIEHAMKALKLDEFHNRWIVGLSNGQMRRARLAKALLKEPRLLLIDEPYLGLDPPSRKILSEILGALPPNPHVVLGLRIQDEYPSWITHVAITDANGVDRQGPKEEIFDYLEFLKQKEVDAARIIAKKSKRARELEFTAEKNEEVIKLDKVSIGYRGQVVLDELEWSVNKGEKWHLRGDNGSGKSTLVSLLTADHPQSWNSKIVINGEPRETGKHNYFDINDAIGHTSPEIHAIFPSKYTVFDSIATGYIVGSMIPPKNLTSEQTKNINDLIEEFELDPTAKLYDLSLSDQKTVLFLRSVVKKPDLLILDEAFSAMESWRVEQCKAFINNWSGTVIVIGHIDDEIPVCDKYIRLHPKGGKPEVGAISE